MPIRPFEPNVFDAENQKLLQEIEFEIYGSTGGLATDPEIESQYLAGFERPETSALMQSVLADRRWGFIKDDRRKLTTVAIADALGTDHATISRAFHWGIMPVALKRYLMSHRRFPPELALTIKSLYDVRKRCAFISSANYLAGKRPGSRWPMLDNLHEIHAELLFDILSGKIRPTWKLARINGNCVAAGRLVKSVVEDDTRDLLPFWYTKQLRLAVNRLFSQLIADNAFAFRYLCLLQHRWQGIFLAVQSNLESTALADDLA